MRYHYACLLTYISFISPAIVSPEVVDVEIPKDDGGRMRRGLMVIAKVVQNLANNIFFGKEAHMVVLNEFLQGNIVNVTRFLSEVNVSPVFSSVASSFSLRHTEIFSGCCGRRRIGRMAGYYCR